ncbi:MAG: DNA-binding protein [Proteobacteria bacterium]|nr:DNA-binding protein [Pseudomonadota bacterium]
MKWQRKIADALNVTMDYLTDDTGNVTEIKGRAIFDRLLEIEKLEQEEKKTIVHVLDSLLRDAKARKIYAVQ